MSKPKPVNDEPEQYSLTTYEHGDKVRVTAKAAGKQLDKYDFIVRAEDELVVEKHIGGEKYKATHTVPDALPKVVCDRLAQSGYQVVAPTGTYIYVSNPDAPSYKEYGAKLPVDDSGAVLWGETRDSTEKRYRPVVEADDSP